MHGSKLSVKLETKFDRLPLPKKIILPVKKGKFAGLHYEQHKTDPLSIEKLAFKRAAQDRLQIKARGTGRLAIKNAPDLRIGGAKIEVETDIRIEDRILRLLNSNVTKLDFPNIPDVFDKLLRNLFAKHLTKALEQHVHIDLGSILENLRGQLNKPIPITMSEAALNPDYNLELNIEQIEPEFTIDEHGICFALYAALNPKFNEINNEGN